MLPIRLPDSHLASRTWVHGRFTLRVVSLAVVAACSTGPDDPPIDPGPGAGAVVVAVDTTVRFQTMDGWQATAQSGQTQPQYGSWRDALLDLAAADGINRIRLDVRAGIEHTRDGFLEVLTGAITEAQWRCFRYATVNDNGDPTVISQGGYHFSEIDTAMVRVVLPLRQRLAARGETLGITASYIAYTQQTCGGGLYHHSDPEEYAEFAVAVMTHFRDAFGVVPDTWELVNEPAYDWHWPPAKIGPAVLAIDRRLRQAGFTVKLIAPSNANAADALNYTNTLMSSGAASLVSQIGYHRYGGATDAVVQSLGAKARALGIATAMTEHIASGHEDLMTDLTLGMAGTWSQFTLAYPTADNGAQYYPIQGTAVQTGSRTRYLRHFFRHVRRGAVRVAATSQESRIRPVAFQNANGRMVVVMTIATPGALSVGGLRPGRYGVGFETESDSDASAPDITVGSTGRAEVPMPAAGVLVLFQRPAS